MKIVIVMYLLIMTALSAECQHILLKKETKDYAVVDKRGPNLSLYTMRYINFSNRIGTNLPGAEIRHLAIHDVNFGLREKLKISNRFSCGLALNMHFAYYPIRQNNDKIMPDTVIFKRQQIRLTSPGVEGYFRINFDKRRGNYLGGFMDIAGRAEFNALNSVRNVYFDETVKIIENKSRNPFIEPFTAYEIVRGGYNFFSITASYRITNLFKKAYLFPELPPYTIGIEFNTFR